jgi:hypothetical protein
MVHTYFTLDYEQTSVHTAFQFEMSCIIRLNTATYSFPVDSVKLV